MQRVRHFINLCPYQIYSSHKKLPWWHSKIVYRIKVKENQHSVHNKSGWKLSIWNFYLWKMPKSIETVTHISEKWIISNCPEPGKSPKITKGISVFFMDSFNGYLKKTRIFRNISFPKRSQVQKDKNVPSSAPIKFKQL